MAVPLFITCQRKECGAVVQVRDRDQQKHRVCCSRRCAGIMNATANKIQRMQAGRKGGLISGQRRRAKLLLKLKSMTPLEAYKLGRSEGWHAGARFVRGRLAGRAA